MMKVVIRVYSVILLAYTGWRTYDFISSQLPKNDISFWLSIAFLFSTEAGLILWHETGLRHITTREQDYIARAMTWIDFTGSLSAGVADMILRQTLVQGYVIPPALVQFLIYGLPVIMAANVAAVILFETHDAEMQRSKEESALLFEAHQRAMKNLADSRSAFADRMQQHIAQEIERRATGKVQRKSFVDVASSGNGHTKIDKETLESDTVKLYPADVPVNPTIRQPKK